MSEESNRNEHAETYEIMTPQAAAVAWANGDHIEWRDLRPANYGPLRGWERIEKGCGLFLWDRQYRRVIGPPTLEVNGQEIVAPIRRITDMQPGQSYWCVELDCIRLYEWDNTEEHHGRLLRGQCYEDEHQARQARRALILALGGIPNPKGQQGYSSSKSDNEVRA